MEPQSAILQPQRSFARYLTAFRRLGANKQAVRDVLSGLKVSRAMTLGLGPSMTRSLGCVRPELRAFPALTGVGVEVPSTQSDLWIWINGDEPGVVVNLARELSEQLEPWFEFDAVVDGFKNQPSQNGLGRDLTGYEDGTENPVGDAMVSAALAADGSSFVAVQAWKHDLKQFAKFSRKKQDDLIGRRKVDNEELSDAPEFAHVKRTAQESFSPEAFIVRRSLPWAGPSGEGLMFVAFGASFDPFEAQLRRMVGLDDGIVDGCFQFSRPMTGGYYWCPPVSDEGLIIC